MAACSENKSPKSDKAYQALIRLLSRRDYSELELKQKLGRYYTTDAIQTALQKAAEYKWLKEPQELAQSYSEILNRKGKGHSAVLRELKKRGLPAIDRNDEREIEKAKSVLAKKFRGKAKLDMKERQKAYRLLAYRGFDSETISAAMRSLAKKFALTLTGDHEEF